MYTNICLTYSLYVTQPRLPSTNSDNSTLLYDVRLTSPVQPLLPASQYAPAALLGLRPTNNTLGAS